MEFVVRHHLLIGAALATLVGACAFNTYRAGVAVGAMRYAAGEQARAASEALGG